VPRFPVPITPTFTGFASHEEAFIEFGNILNPTVAMVPVLMKLLLDTFSISDCYK